MVNFIQRGDTLTVKAPYAATSGSGMKIGTNLFGVAGVDAAQNDLIEAAIEGVFDLAKDASTFTDGAPVYWDDTAKKGTSTASTNLKIGVAALIQPDGTSALGGATGDATVRVRLNGSF
jgi:predicted RecA/RadA family phage recombinase